MSHIDIYQREAPTIESYWRSIVLFGVNNASYKFALAQSLLNIAKTGISSILLEDIALPYAQLLCSHLKHHPKQTTGQTPPFVQACLKYNKIEISLDDLVLVTMKHGFRYVLDAFHVVNRESVPLLFFEKDFSEGRKRLILTNDIQQLAYSSSSFNLQLEIEARWRLVETAWENGLNPAMLGVKYDESEHLLYTVNTIRRRNITSAKDALNGYQKGKCFYCFQDIDLDNQLSNACDVDHFYPHILKPYMPNINLDGVWNLVLSCKNCNRGINGKFSKVPAMQYVQRLHKRNEFLICSHHPLRETLMQQTGYNETARCNFIRSVDTMAATYLLHRWETETTNPEAF